MIRPQLARAFRVGKDDWMWDDPGLVAEEKLNGHRILIVGDRQFSRYGKEHDIPFLKRGFPDGSILDGEVIVRRDLGLPSGHSEVNHWLAFDPSKLEVVIFDIVAWNESSRFDRCSLESRLLVLREFADEHRHLFTDGVSIAVQHRENKRAFYDKIVENGGEGVMLKYLDRPYDFGSRANWIKVKAWEEVDVVITDCDALPSKWRVKPGEIDKQTGFVCPDGDYTESWKLGYVGLRYGFFDRNGRLRVVGSTGITGPREEMQQYVGRVATFKTFGKQFSTGAIQHPVFVAWREDKAPEECVFDFEE